MQDEKDRAKEPPLRTSTWDHSSHEKFYDYYAEASQTEKRWQHFRSIRDTLLRVIGRDQPVARTLKVADVGCNAGTMSIVWAELGHEVHGLDVNEPLLELARKRAASAGYVIDFQLGSAVELPWTDEAMDVCISLEMLEHVADWEPCLIELVRILRPGGVLYLATSNKLCPKQQEFNLPLYSWYPAPIKRYVERLSVTTRPDLTNFAKYPAVNWFSFYSLRSELAARGFQSMDRFDIMDLSNKGTLARWIISSIRKVSVLRFLGHVATPTTIMVAIKKTG
jgi:2-polyprenyl-6-hydroxyphenyl methylase/3-demethylubiquinone-9 3-methyltransferase